MGVLFPPFFFINFLHSITYGIAGVCLLLFWFVSQLLILPLLLLLKSDSCIIYRNSSAKCLVFQIKGKKKHKSNEKKNNQSAQQNRRRKNRQTDGHKVCASFTWCFWMNVHWHKTHVTCGMKYFPQTDIIHLNNLGKHISNIIMINMIVIITNMMVFITTTATRTSELKQIVTVAHAANASLHVCHMSWNCVPLNTTKMLLLRVYGLYCYFLM